MEQRDEGPSVPFYSVIGYLVASAVGVVIVVVLSVRAGDSAVAGRSRNGKSSGFDRVGVDRQ